MKKKQSTKNEKLVSVIIPIYNCEKYLKRSIESALEQTYRQLEILLINDGSTDHSSSVCNEYQKKDSRIKVYHKENGGVSSARNVGIANANGEFVLFLDADDFISKNMIEDLMSLWERNKTDLVICNFANEELPNKFVPYYKGEKCCIFEQKNMIENLLRNKYYSCSLGCVLLRKKSIEGQYWDENITHYEDLKYLYEVMKKCKNATFTSNVYYYYCTNQGSASTGEFSDKMMSMVDVCEYILDDVVQVYPELCHCVQNEFVRNNIMCAMLAAKFDYKNKNSIKRLRKNILRYLNRFLVGYSSIGYKIYALIIVCSWNGFVRIWKYKREN